MNIYVMLVLAVRLTAAPMTISDMRSAEAYAAVEPASIDMLIPAATNHWHGSPALSDIPRRHWMVDSTLVHADSNASFQSTVSHGEPRGLAGLSSSKIVSFPSLGPKF